jgi:hypothetical protein
MQLRKKIVGITVTVAMCLTMAVACGGGFPAPVAAPAPPALRRISVALVGGGGYGFGGALRKALTEAGLHLVDVTEPYDLVIMYVALGYEELGHREDEPTRFGVGVSLSDAEKGFGDTSSLSWTLRYKATGGSGGGRSLLGGVDACAEAWARETAGQDRRGSAGTPADPPFSARSAGRMGVGVLGVRAGDYRSTGEDDLGPAYYLVNKLLGCPGFAEAAQAIEGSGVAAGARLEDLATDKLLNMCRFNYEDLRGSDGYLASACRILSTRGPSAAAAVQGLEAKRAADQAARDREAATQERPTNLSNGCTRENPVACGNGENRWCCPNAYPVCGGCGNNCCPGGPVQQQLGPSAQCIQTCGGQWAFCRGQCGHGYGFELCQAQCDVGKNNCYAGCR